LLPPDFLESSLEELMRELAADRLDPYLTTVGGSGLGILAPSAHHSVATAVAAAAARPNVTIGADRPSVAVGGQVTPPADAGDVESLRKLMEAKNVERLSEWAAGLGHWLYV